MHLSVLRWGWKVLQFLCNHYDYKLPQPNYSIERSENCVGDKKADDTTTECIHEACRNTWSESSGSGRQQPIRGWAGWSRMHQGVSSMDQEQSVEWDVDLEYAAFEGFGPQDTQDGIEFYWEDSEPLPWWKYLTPPFLR